MDNLVLFACLADSGSEMRVCQQSGWEETKVRFIDRKHHTLYNQNFYLQESYFIENDEVG